MERLESTSIFGSFTNKIAVDAAVERLKSNGFESSGISVIMPPEDGNQSRGVTLSVLADNNDLRMKAKEILEYCGAYNVRQMGEDNADFDDLENDYELKVSSKNNAPKYSSNSSSIKKLY